jgi:transposase
VHRHIRPQYACKNCETITAAPIPAAVINGGMAAVGLLVWVLISKYVDHLPLYRLEQIAARQQVVLSRSTLADWVGRLGVALQPLVDRLTWHLLQGNTFHADESVPRRRAQKVKVLQCSYAAQEMRVGPSESPYRRRLQTTYCCCA